MHHLLIWIALAMTTIANFAAAEPLVFDNGRIFIAAHIAGVRTEALLDSGAEATVVDASLAEQAHLPPGTPQSIKGSGGITTARIVPDVTLHALGLTLTPEAIVVMDLSEVSQRLIKRPTRSILGRELFDAARLRIDLTSASIDVVPALETPPGVRLPLSAHAGIEAVPAMLAGRAVQAEFDLGNGSEVMISRALATSLGLKPAAAKAGGGIGGAIRRDLVRLPRLVLAGRSFDGLVAAIDDQPTANDLNVGTVILRHFLITTDFRRRSVWLANKGS